MWGYINLDGETAEHVKSTNRICRDFHSWKQALPEEQRVDGHLNNQLEEEVFIRLGGMKEFLVTWLLKLFSILILYNTNHSYIIQVVN